MDDVWSNWTLKVKSVVMTPNVKVSANINCTRWPRSCNLRYPEIAQCFDTFWPSHVLDRAQTKLTLVILASGVHKATLSQEERVVISALDLLHWLFFASKSDIYWPVFFAAKEANPKLSSFSYSTGENFTFLRQEASMISSAWDLIDLDPVLFHTKLYERWLVTCCNPDANGTRFWVTPPVYLRVILTFRNGVKFTTRDQLSFKVANKRGCRNSGDDVATKPETQLAILVAAHAVHQAILRQQMTVLLTACDLRYVDVKAKSLWTCNELNPLHAELTTWVISDHRDLRKHFCRRI